MDFGQLLYWKSTLKQQKILVLVRFFAIKSVGYMKPKQNYIDFLKIRSS
jgi:hypothetical protein